ncbi:MAG: transglutaminase-like cysteine peptidase [Candidatus Accumulibacter sp.]|jgi:predicted transglutaminase-like cysteine proteinase|nr:transglutaminase-like cysteine peptidase [Accumulibacter sp.]
MFFTGYINSRWRPGKMMRMPPVARSEPGGCLAIWPGLLTLLALCLALAAPVAQARQDPGALRQRLAARFDSSRIPLLDEWLAMVASASALDEQAKLARVNDFVNGNFAYEDDATIWEQNDYWATPLEMIGKGRGDCEDFTIVKYVSLRMAGMGSARLRLVYAKARLDGLAGPVWVAHMVLAYYATPDAEPLVLDNLNETILPASRRPDLQPVFSFNSEGIFAGVSGKGAAKAAAGIGRLSRWEDAWRRILADGYE